MEVNVSITAAFAAGIVSVLSPCVIPVLPAYTAYLAGAAASRTVMVNAVFFFLGFTAVFIVMGATASLLGQLFIQYQELIRRIGAVVMIMMGGQLAGIFSIPLLNRDYRPLLGRGPEIRGPLGAFILGVAFTAGWTPCIGPVLATILLYAGSAASVKTSILLLFAYAVGFAIPFLAMALLFSQYGGRLKNFVQFLPFFQKAAGVIIMITGVLLYFDLLAKIIEKAAG